jgi:holdfast attachment protein HfaA
MSDRNSTLNGLARVTAPLVAVLAIAGAAHAQSMTTNSASFNGGFGRANGSENAPINVQMGDVNGNITVINGMITGAQAGSIFAGSIFAGAGASASAAGAADVFAGAGGSGSASAIGNNLSVVTQGNNNTVIVTSVQSNTGDVTANTTVNGRP